MARRRVGSVVAASLSMALFASPALAQSCGGDFSRWLAGARAEAAQIGIGRAGRAALANVRQDARVLQRDRAQGFFAQGFLQFADKVIPNARLQKGRAALQRNAALFRQIERQYGVPGPVLAAYWGLETDYGAFQGDFPTLNALATLAHDCRRPEFFRPQLMAALRLVDRGDFTPQRMVGAWAGELGHTQLLPSDVQLYGVDADGDGRRDVIASAADALATSAALLRVFGWRPGEPWLQEVRVPANAPWHEAGLERKHPRAQWARWGVTGADGRPLPADNLPASLHLPMGRGGPAFLAYPNFNAYLEWNRSLTYSTVAAYFATRLAGAPAVTRGRPAPALSQQQAKQLQTLLQRRGHDVGAVDGIIGAKTREAVRAEQMRLGLPADSWPTAELLARLR